MFSFDAFRTSYSDFLRNPNSAGLAQLQRQLTEAKPFLPKNKEEKELFQRLGATPEQKAFFARQVQSSNLMDVFTRLQTAGVPGAKEAYDNDVKEGRFFNTALLVAQYQDRTNLTKYNKVATVVATATPIVAAKSSAAATPVAATHGALANLGAAATPVAATKLSEPPAPERRFRVHKYFADIFSLSPSSFDVYDDDAQIVKPADSEIYFKLFKHEQPFVRDDLKRRFHDISDKNVKTIFPAFLADRTNGPYRQYLLEKYTSFYENPSLVPGADLTFAFLLCFCAVEFREKYELVTKENKETQAELADKIKRDLRSEIQGNPIEIAMLLPYVCYDDLVQYIKELHVAAPPVTPPLLPSGPPPDAPPVKTHVTPREEMKTFIKPDFSRDVLERRDWNTLGITNTGNTCFISSPLQLLMSVGSLRNWLETSHLPFDENVYVESVCTPDVEIKMENLVSVLKSMHNKLKTEETPYQLSDIELKETNAERFLFDATNCHYRTANDAETIFQFFTNLWCIRDYANSLDMLLTIFTMNKDNKWNFFVSVKNFFSMNREIQKSVQTGLQKLSADNDLFLHPKHAFLVVEVNPGPGIDPVMCEARVAVTNNYDNTKAMYTLRCAVVYTEGHFIFVTYDEDGEMNGGWDDEYKLVREGDTMKVINDLHKDAKYPIPFLKANVVFVLYEKEEKIVSLPPFVPSSLPSQEAKSVVIGERTFELLCKFQESERMFVKIKSFSANGKTNEFSVYSSLSELGLWRLCRKYWRGMLYKGDNESEYYDYAQATLLHLDLQKCINENLDTLKEDEKAFSCNDEGLEYGIRAIDSLYRPTNVEPFATFHKKQYVRSIATVHQKKYVRKPIEHANQCGKLWRDEHMDELNRLSQELRNRYSIKDYIKLYTVDKSSGVNVNEATWKFQYDVYLVQLQKKGLAKGKGIIYLMFAHVKTFESKYTSKTVNKENVFWPFGLTLNLHCSELGLYETFINAGRYVCKFSDYGSQLLSLDKIKDASYNEKFPSLGPETRGSNGYVYIADIYQDLFPLPEMRSKLGV